MKKRNLIAMIIIVAIIVIALWVFVFAKNTAEPTGLATMVGGC